MSDELDARVRSLMAERLRPVPPRPSRPASPVSDAAMKRLADLDDALSGQPHQQEGEIWVFFAPQLLMR